MVAFVGWSGDKCEKAAQELIQLLGHCFRNFITFRISSVFPKGDGWREKLREQLHGVQFAILCVTADSRPDWLCYEAGALAEKTPIATIFFEEPQALFSPLKDFQNVKFNETDIQLLVEALHKRSFEAASTLGVQTPHLDLNETLGIFRERYSSFETNVAALLRASASAADKRKMVAFVGCWGEKCAKAANALIQLLTPCLGDVIDFQMAAEPSPAQLKAWANRAAFSVLCLTDESLSPWPSYAAGVLSATGTVSAAFFEREAENLETLFPPLSAFLRVKFKNERANKNKDENENEREFEKLVSALCDRYAETAPDASANPDNKALQELRNKALRELRRRFPDFKTNVEALSSGYPIGEFEKDLRAINDLGGDMKWPYQAGVTLLGVLRSDKMCILEKALAIRDYREEILAKYLQQYPDKDNRISELYAKTGKLT